MVSNPSDNNQQQVAQTNQFTSVLGDVDNGAVLLDVRTPEEYFSGHFEGATNLSLQDIQAGALPTSPLDTKTYVYCRSGNRSAQATELLRRAGYTNIVDLGGLSDVQALGGELIR